MCFNPEAPTLGVFAIAFPSNGVILAELRITESSLVERCLLAIEMVRLRVFDFILRDSSFPAVENLPPFDLGE